MLDGPEYRRWRDEARSAAETGRLARDGGRYNWACFLAEQAAQLGVKAVLHGVGAAPWGHDLLALGDNLAGFVGAPLAEDLQQAMTALARHYIPARYPDAHPGGAPGERYTRADAGQALADARTVLGAVDEVWGRLLVEAEQDQP